MALQPHWPPSKGTSILLYPRTVSILIFLWSLLNPILLLVFLLILFCEHYFQLYRFVGICSLATIPNEIRGFVFSPHAACHAHLILHYITVLTTVDVRFIVTYIYIYIFGAPVLVLFRSVIKCTTNTHATWSPFVTLLSRHAKSGRRTSFRETGLVYRITYSFSDFLFCLCFIYSIYSWYKITERYIQ